MNIHQQSFITEYLRTGDKIQSYKNAYHSESANYNSLESAANRLMRIPEVANTIQAIQDSIRAEVEAELKAQLKQELLTIRQKRELLAQIATGEMYAEQHYKGKNCSQCTQYIKPTINQMLKAIDLDNKLAGHYRTKENKKTPLLFLAQKSRKHSGAGDIGRRAESSNLSPDSYRDGEVASQEPVHPVKHRNLSRAGGGDFEEVGGGTHNTAKQETHTLRLSDIEIKKEENTTKHNNEQSISISNISMRPSITAVEKIKLANSTTNHNIPIVMTEQRQSSAIHLSKTDSPHFPLSLSPCV